MEDEEMFMNVAIQMYAGMLSSCSCYRTLVSRYACLAGADTVGHICLIHSPIEPIISTDRYQH
jgi:hypothetical protein